MIAVTLFSYDSCSLLMHKQNIIWIYYHALWPVLFELSLSLYMYHKAIFMRFACAYDADARNERKYEQFFSK